MIAALIPARGGSTRLPRKNLAVVAGEPLVGRAVRESLSAGFVPYVSTDDQEIADVAASLGAIVHRRSAATATNTASTESVIEEWWRSLVAEPRMIALVQPCTVVRERARHMREAVELLERYRASSIVGVTEDTHEAFAGRLIPRELDEHGTVYDWRPHRPWGVRPRTQDVMPQGREDGAFWIFTAEHWTSTRSRDGGKRCLAYPMHRYSTIDVDDERDLEGARAMVAAWEEAIDPYPVGTDVEVHLRWKWESARVVARDPRRTTVRFVDGESRTINGVGTLTRSTSWLRLPGENREP